MVSFSPEPSSSSMMVWTLPLPKVWVPRITARLLSCSAPATISLALAGRPSHRLDGAGLAQLLGALAVDLDHLVAGLDAGAGGRGVVDRGHDRQHLVLLRDLDAQAAELARGVDLHVLERLGGHEERVR